MSEPAPAPPTHGLDRVETLLFLFGVVAFAVLMLIFGHDLGESTYLPVVALWLVAGVGFVWWFDRHMAGKR